MVRALPLRPWYFVSCWCFGSLRGLSLLSPLTSKTWVSTVPLPPNTALHCDRTTPLGGVQVGPGTQHAQVAFLRHLAGDSLISRSCSQLHVLSLEDLAPATVWARERWCFL